MLLYDNEFLPQAIALIESAKSHIRIATFKAEIPLKPQGLKLKRFFDILAEKKSQGIQIDFLINKNDNKRGNPRSNIPTIQYLKARKINVRTLRDNRCAHAKVILVDQERAIIGSHNLSMKSCFENFETSFLVSDPANIARLAAVYNETWRSGKADD